MKTLITVGIFSLLFAWNPTQDTVTLSVIEANGEEKTVEFDWPFNGPPPVGADSVLTATVDTMLQENGVDCPPERVKVSGSVWRCGNGKKIRTYNERLGELLSIAWDD